MDAGTAELRGAHDQLAELYAEKLTGALPAERAVLGLFAELVRPLGTEIGDVGCGAGRLAPILAGYGLQPRGVDLSPEMVRVARRDHPGVPFEVADVRRLPFGDGTLAGVVAWYSLMYLTPAERPEAWRELARVTRPGGHLATAYKVGDGTHRRGGQSVGVEFDIWWQTPEEVRRQAQDAGFEPVFWAGAPGDAQPQGFLVARYRS